MAIAVVGFDLGFQSCYTAVARAGGIETVANEYTDRCTPTCLAFTESTRYTGHAARQQIVTNMRSTLHGFAKLVGKDFDNPLVQAELPYVPFKMLKSATGGVGFEVSYLGETVIFTAEQCVAMMLTKLKQIAESNLKTPVIDCVVNVPSYFNDRERRAMLDACQIAGLNCLKLINDITAIALSYGIYKKDLPAQDKDPKRVVFVDFGHCDLQVGVVAFNDGQMKVLSTACDPCLGGRNLVMLIFNHFVQDFESRYKLDVTSNPKAQLKLIEECQKLKKLMSANSTDIPLNIECFMNDKDVSGKMNRATFETLMQDDGVLKRIEDCLKQALSNANLKVTDISSVEIVGGATRVPVVKEIIRALFNQEPRTTLNADESVARGCALQCAILSPAFKVRDFSITDWHPFSISLAYDDPLQSKDDSVEVFPFGHQFPFSKALTFYRSSAFDVTAFYTDQSIPPSDRMIGQFRISNIQPQADGSNAKIKVKIRINSHGIFTVCQARATELVDKVVETSSPAPEVSQETPKAEGELADTESAPPAEGEKDAEKKSPTKNTKKVVKYIDLPIESLKVKQLVKKILMEYQDKEGQMVMQEVQEKERSNCKNSVEEYVYEMRDRLAGQLEAFVTDQERESLSSQLTDTEDWLYGDGENVAKQAYIDRLSALRKLGDRYVVRAKEFADRPVAAELLGRSIQHASKVYDAWIQGDELYNHLTKDDMDKVAKVVEEKRQWLISQMNAQNNLRQTDDPILTAAQIDLQRTGMDAVVKPIISKQKPKPKVEEPPPAENKTSENGGDQKVPEAGSQPEVTNSNINGDAHQKDTDMDLD